MLTHLKSAINSSYNHWLCGFLMILLVSESKGQHLSNQLPKTPLTTSYETSEFDAGIQNLSFDQDSSKTLYVANNFGLLEFDGQNWTFFRVPNSTKTRAIFIDNQDRIYTGGQGQIGYFKQEASGLQFTSLLNKLPDDQRNISEVWSIYAHDQSIYFQTLDQLLRLRNERVEIIEFPGNPINSFPVDSSVIVHVENEGLFKLEGDEIEFLEGTESIKTQVNGIHATTQGLLIYQVDGKISHYSKNELRRLETKINSMLEEAQINVATELSDGTYAIGTQNDGLFIVDKDFNLLQHLTKNKGLNHRTVYALYEDHRRKLWVGLNNGITYVERNSPLSLINENEGLEGTGYSAIRKNGKVYIGTSSGVFYYDFKSDSPYQLIENSVGQAYNLSTINNTVFLSHNDGIFQIQDEFLKPIFQETGAWKLEQTGLQNTLMAGTYTGLVLVHNANSTSAISRIKGDFTESSRVFEFENDSTLWVSHGYKGAYRLQLTSDLTEIKSQEDFGSQDGFPSDILISVYKLNGQLVFTSERGIFQFNDSSKTFTKNRFLNKYLGDQHVSKLSQDPNGNIYFIAGNEIGLLRQNGFENYEKIDHVFNRVNRYLSNDLENISVLDPYNVLFGAKEGFIHYNPSLEFNSDEEITVNLRSIEIKTLNDSSIHINPSFFEAKELTSVASVKFKFASPLFDSSEEVQFSYRLTPFESKWSEWSGGTFKEYTNLQADNYTFEVRARSSLGSVSKPKSINFEVIPVWYKSRLASVAFLAFILLGGGLLYYRQGKKYETEREEIYSQKAIELKARDEKIDEISTKSAERIDQLKSEKLRAEIDYKNSQLASVTMHLLSKNEFVQDVRKRIHEIAKNSTGGSGDLKKIIKNIDQNLIEDDSWDQFAIHFDQVHGDFFKKLAQRDFKLTPQETKLAAYLRMNMSSKEIANLMNISVRGVELARYRLRKKIQLERDQNLVEYLMSI